MPPRLSKPPKTGMGTGDLAALKNKRYGYKYDSAYGLDLRPGSEAHDSIVTDLTEFANNSYSFQQRNHTSWLEMDRLMHAFIPLSDAERLRQEKDVTKPVSIVIPYSYGVEHAIHSQYLGLLASMETLYPINPMGPEDTVGSMLLEKLLDMQNLKFNHILTLSYQAHDFLRYGFGVISPMWEQIMTKKTKRVPRMEVSALTGEPIATDQFDMVQEDYLEFSGNSLSNIEPWYYLPDPNFAITDVQKSEFVAYETRMSYFDLLGNEELDFAWFNAKFLADIAPDTYLTNQRQSSIRALRENAVDNSVSSEYKRVGSDETVVTRVNDVTVYYVRLIPREFFGRFSKAYDWPNTPETWSFAVVGDTVLVHAARILDDHCQKPVCVAAPTSDGYSTSPVAHLEITRGTQKAVDFLWNSHMTFIMKFQRGRWMGYQDMVNVQDILKGSDFVRVSKEAMMNPNGLSSILQPVQMGDPTINNVNNIGFLQDIMQRATGGSDPIQGILATRGERRSAEEARGARMGAMSRIEHMLLMSSLQCWRSAVYQMVRNTQQYLSDSMYVRMVGRWEEELLSEYGARASQNNWAQDARGFFPVRPADLDVGTDVGVLDFSVRGDSFEAWTNLYGMIANNPTLMQALDVVRIFKHIARLGGAKNVSDFALAPGSVVAQSVSDQQALEMQSKGQIGAL